MSERKICLQVVYGRLLAGVLQVVYRLSARVFFAVRDPHLASSSDSMTIPLNFPGSKKRVTDRLTNRRTQGWMDGPVDASNNIPLFSD